jgi:hypothetical protein
MSEFGRLIREIVQGIGSAFLPSPERERYARERGVDPPSWSMLLGIGQLCGGLPLFLFGGLTFMEAAFSAPARVLLENWWPGLQSTHFQGVTMLNWFGWFLHPASWPLLYLSLVGLARCLAYAASREAVGDPVVWAVVRLWQRLSSARESRTLQERLGPPRPDRISEGGEFDLVVLSAREKPEWAPGITVEYDERFFQVVGREFRPDRGFESFAYLLDEQDPAEIIRRLVRYTCPTRRDSD